MVASHAGRASVGIAMDVTSGPARRRVGAGVLHLLWLVFLVSGVMAVSVVDADGDPTTTNLPSVVLTVESRLPSTDDTSPARPDVGARADRRRSVSLRRWALPRFEVIATAHRGHLRVRPVRGP